MGKKALAATKANIFQKINNLRHDPDPACHFDADP